MTPSTGKRKRSSPSAPTSADSQLSTATTHNNALGQLLGSASCQASDPLLTDEVLEDLYCDEVIPQQPATAYQVSVRDTYALMYFPDHRATLDLAADYETRLMEQAGALTAQRGAWQELACVTLAHKVAVGRLRPGFARAAMNAAALSPRDFSARLQDAEAECAAQLGWRLQRNV